MKTKQYEKENAKRRNGIKQIETQHITEGKAKKKLPVPMLGAVTQLTN